MRASLQPLMQRLSEIAATRISRSEIAGMRHELHSFLFRDLGMAQEVTSLLSSRQPCNPVWQWLPPHVSGLPPYCHPTTTPSPRV